VRKQRGAMSNKNDRRSQRTRHLLGEALVDLMMEKGYNAITVSDIIERANVGRSTFYAHYRDKDNLLVSEFAPVVDVLSLHSPHNAAGNPFFPSLGLFQHVGEQHKLYKVLVWGSGADLPFKYMQKLLSEKIEQGLNRSGRGFDIPLPILANFVAGSFLTLLKWWMDNKTLYSAEQIDEIFQKLTMPGIEQANVK